MPLRTLCSKQLLQPANKSSYSGVRPDITDDSVRVRPGIFVFLMFLFLFGKPCTLFSEEINRPKIKVNIIVLTDRSEALDAINKENLDWMFEALNNDFRNKDGVVFAEFELGKIFTIDESRKLEPEIFEIKDDRDKWNALIKKYVDKIENNEIFDKRAFNICIYNDPNSNARSTGGFKFRNLRQKGVAYTLYNPRMILHWRVLKAHYGPILVHEAGHAFGLGHVRPESKTSDFKDNIMTGKETDSALPDAIRGYFFTDSQTETIRLRLSQFMKTVSFYHMR